MYLINNGPVYSRSPAHNKQNIALANSPGGHFIQDFKRKSTFAGPDKGAEQWIFFRFGFLFFELLGKSGSNGIRMFFLTKIPMHILLENFFLAKLNKGNFEYGNVGNIVQRQVCRPRRGDKCQRNWF